MSIIDHGELLNALGLEAGASELDQELARMALCKKFGLPPTVPDEALLRLARHWKATHAEKHQEVVEPKPAKSGCWADAGELAKIPRTSQTGLRTVMTARSSHQGLRFGQRDK